MSVITDGIRILRDDGWIKNEYHNENGHCLQGALTQASVTRDSRGRYSGRKSGELLRAQYCIARVVEREFGLYVAPDNLEHWNDQYAEDVDQVIHVMKLAQEMLDGLPDLMLPEPPSVATRLQGFLDKIHANKKLCQEMGLTP